jgi:hypothetical protein
MKISKENLKELLMDALGAIIVIIVFVASFLALHDDAYAGELKSRSIYDEDVPEVVGYVKNENGGRIILTSGSGDCNNPGFPRFMYATNNGGQIMVAGCYGVSGEGIVAKWSNGQMYRYELEDIEFTQEWMNYSRNN